MNSVTLGFIWTEILLEKVWHEKCDPWFYMNWNFAQKSATLKMWPLVLYKLKFCSKKCDMKRVTLGFYWLIYETKFCSKKCDMKCVTLGFYWLIYETKFCSKKCDMNSVTLWFIWTEILLQKVRHEKCDPWFYMNWNFAQKSATWNVWPLVFTGLYMKQNFAQKSATWKVWPLVLEKRYGGHTI